MADTIRTDAANIANFANNPTGQISAQDIRDGYLSLAARAGFRLGTSGGTAQAQTLSTGLSLSDWATGLRFSFYAGFANTAADPTMTLDALAARTMKHRDGSAFKANALRSGSLYSAEYDGTVVRVLDAGGWIDQTSYDRMYPVGGFVMIRWDNVNPNSELPSGVTATWTEITNSNSFGAALALRAAGTVGTFEGQEGFAVGDHSHPVSGTTGAPTATVSAGGAGDNPASGTHVHSVSGTATSAGAHGVNLDFRRAIVRAWVRSA
jgi:hypothetical protein